MKNWKDNVYFILVEPREQGNIGAAARAIKNMDFKNLCLVKPPSHMTDEAKWFAHNAMDILESSKTFASVKAAVRDKHFVVGTSRRRGRRRGVFIPIEQGTNQLFKIAQNSKIAVLFGREDRGLFNEEVEECGFLMTIPASRKQPSLNLAQAVLIIAYELLKAGMSEMKGKRESGTASLLIAETPKAVSQEDLSHLYNRLENALKMIEYIPQGDKFLNKKIMQNLKHCLGRARLTDWEFNMFHGICKHIEKKMGDGSAS
jgi:TrmH family RNA methyltransferase